MLKDSCLNFLRKSKLYQSRKDNMEQLIQFLQYPVKRFTVEEICGYHQLQLKIQDELLYLSGMPSYLKPIDLVDAESRIDELCQLCLQMQIFVSHVTASGVERFALEHQAELDLDGQYYVKMDARELTVDNSVCEKPVTLDDMNAIAKCDDRYYLEQSVWRDVYGSDLYHIYYLPERVGFDRTKFNVDIIDINIDKLLEAKRELQRNSYSELPRIRIDYIDPEDKDDMPLVLPVPETYIKKIEITLSHHVKFRFQRNNTPLHDDGRRKRDIYLLEVTVQPDTGYEVLGNIKNYSYDEMRIVVEKAVNDLYALTGIKVDTSTIRLNDVELNLTFRQNCKFDHLMRSVSYYQNYTRRGYITKEFKTSDAGIVRCMDNIMAKCNTEDDYNRTKRAVEQKYAKMRSTGYVTANQSISVKLYDKKEETIAYAKSQGYDLKIEGDEAIVRLEFRIRNSGQLQNYFDTDAKPVYFSKLTQEDLERTYVALVDTFFKSPYEKQYVPDSLKALTAIIKSIDTSKKGGKWKQELIREVLSQEIWQKSTPALLSEKDIISVMQHNKTFAAHPKKYREILLELLRESDTYEKGQENAYDMLFNFLIKTYYLRTLSSARRIGFAVAGSDEKLPDKEKELVLAMDMRKKWNELNNLYL